MKGITANKFYTYLSILIAIVVIINAYISLPEMVWIIQTGTIDKVCPPFKMINQKLIFS